MGVLRDPCGAVKRSNDKLVFWVYGIVVPLLIVAIIVVGYHDRTRFGRDGVQARRALCAFRIDLEARVKNTQAFLRTHPTGLPELGISAGTMRNTLRNQQESIDSLDSLKC